MTIPGLRSILLLAAWLVLATASSAGVPRRPFPQHVGYAGAAIRPSTISPGALDDSVRAFYDRWKARYLAPACTAGEYYILGGPEIPNGLGVSEGQGYGMVITAFMAGDDPDARAIFDGLYAYYRGHPSENNHDLMAWLQLTGCVSSADSNSASDGDIVTYRFKKYKLGPVIGKRTWGGVVGIRGSLPLLDGGVLNRPDVSRYDTEGQSWIMEGVGVEPDIMVDNDPAREFAGVDDQLTKAIEVIKEEMKKKPATLPPPPPYPDKH